MMMVMMMGNGGDNDDGDWPVDGTKGVFVLNCAKTILIQLTAL
jgi:hypothetical protein